jgi:hypothetical protein
MRYLFSFLILVFSASFLNANAQQSDGRQPMNRWVDSVYSSLSVEQRVAQLIFVRANYPYQPYLKSSGKYIRKYNLGGVCFFWRRPGITGKTV